jgi:hypothetical protein
MSSTQSAWPMEKSSDPEIERWTNGGKYPSKKHKGEEEVASIENDLISCYLIQLVPQRKGTEEMQSETKEKDVKLTLNLKTPHLYDQGEDGACAFFFKSLFDAYGEIG